MEQKFNESEQENEIYFDIDEFISRIQILNDFSIFEQFIKTKDKSIFYQWGNLTAYEDKNIKNWVQFNIAQYFFDFQNLRSLYLWVFITKLIYLEWLDREDPFCGENVDFREFLKFLDRWMLEEDIFKRMPKDFDIKYFLKIMKKYIYDFDKTLEEIKQRFEWHEQLLEQTQKEADEIYINWKEDWIWTIIWLNQIRQKIEKSMRRRPPKPWTELYELLKEFDV